MTTEAPAVRRLPHDTCVPYVENEVPHWDGLKAVGDDVPHWIAIIAAQDRAMGIEQP